MDQNLSSSGQPDDICRAKHGGNPQSEAANASIHGRKPSLRLQIQHYLRLKPSTTEEVAIALHMRMSTASARMSEMRRDGVIRPNGELRRTTSGEWAAVCEVVNAK